MAMQRQANRFSLPPALENARNVDAKMKALLNGAPLVIKDGMWQPESAITANYFVGKAAAALTKGSPVSVAAAGIVSATSGDVQGVAANDAVMGADVTVLRQGNLSIPALAADTLLYINTAGKLVTTKSDGSYFVGYTTTAGNAFFLMGGSGGGGGGTSPTPSAGGNLFSGMQVRYLVPQGTTWDREPDKCVVAPELPKVVQKSTNFVFSSPFGNRPALAQVYFKNPITGVWTITDVIFSSPNSFGLTANCPGDGNVYLAVGQYFANHTQGPFSPKPTGEITSGEVIIALYCQVTETVATHVVGSRQKYLIAPGSSWNRGNEADYITLPDMPATVAGGTARNWKLVSPFGNKITSTEAWIKFAGRWNRGEELIYSAPNRFGVRSACPGDGYIHVNIANYPQNNDSPVNIENIPSGSTNTAGSTYKDYEICIIAVVQDTVELPTISAKELRDITALGEAIELGAAIPIPVTTNVAGSDAAGQATWVAPADGLVTLQANNGEALVRLRNPVSGAVFSLIHATSGPTRIATVQVTKDQTYSFRRTDRNTPFYYTPNKYDETKYAIYSKTGGGGPVNPEDAIRVGEVRNYNRYDTEISSNPSFVDISEAVEVNTSDYPDFAALVGVTGMYPIPLALNVGGQTLPYIYLGKFIGSTPPEKLPADILITSDAGATGGIIFVTDDGSLDIAVSMATIGGEDTALTSPGLLFNVGTDTDMIPIDAVLKATSDINAEPDTPGLLIRYEKKS